MSKLEFRINGLTEDEPERRKLREPGATTIKSRSPGSGLSLSTICLITLAIVVVYKLQQRQSYISLDVFGRHSVNTAAGTGVFGDNKKIPHALEGKIYLLPENTERLPDFSKLTTVGTTFATDLNVTPRSFTEGLPGVIDRNTWFAIDYTGTFLVPEEGDYVFTQTSDDGSKLFVDGQLVIDLDGIHSPATLSGMRHLKYGPHDIRVQYFQGPPAQIALVLDINKQ